MRSKKDIFQLMKSEKKILMCLAFLFATSICKSQKLDGKYYKTDCRINITKKSQDSIIAFGSPQCSSLKIDTTLNGTWIVYSNIDSTTVIYRSTIINNKLEGLVFSHDESMKRKQYIQYKEGKKNGASLSFDLHDRITNFYNYDMDKISGDYYYYQYNDANAKLAKTSHFDEKGKLKEEKLYDTGVYDKFKSINKK